MAGRRPRDSNPASLCGIMAGSPPLTGMSSLPVYMPMIRKYPGFLQSHKKIA
jgi:hypothetical protein